MKKILLLVVAFAVVILGIAIFASIKAMPEKVVITPAPVTLASINTPYSVSVPHIAPLEALNVPELPTLAEATSTGVDTASILRLENGYRAASGENGLVINDKLMKAARFKVADMIKQKFFAHDAPDGTSFSTYIYVKNYVPMKFENGSITFLADSLVGENLAIEEQTAAQVVTDWRLSVPHNENIMNAQYEDTGIYSQEVTLDGAWTWAVEKYGKTTTSTIVYNNKKVIITAQEFGTLHYKKPQ